MQFERCSAGEYWDPASFICSINIRLIFSNICSFSYMMLSFSGTKKIDGVGCGNTYECQDYNGLECNAVSSLCKQEFFKMNKQILV